MAAPEVMEMERVEPAPPPIDVQRIRGDFPILRREIRGKPLVYFDNAATTQKPRVVIDAIRRFYEEDYANIHRGVHLLSEIATEAYEGSRLRVQRFLNASHHREIIFTRGTTEAINLVASTYGREHIGEGDEIVITELEHHSNIVPWQMLCEQIGAVLRVAPMNDRGELRMDKFEKLLGPRTKFVSVVHVSNAFGTINPVERIVELAHKHGALVLLDGAQAVSHVKVDVQKLDCDFYAFSGHKIFGPTGVGVLYGKTDVLNKMPPYQGGGDMIASVTFEKTLYNQLPYKFEAGTPNIVGGVGLKAALDYVDAIGLDAIAAYENELLKYATEKLSQIPGLRIVGTAEKKASVVSFVLDTVHPHDIGTILDSEGIAIRTGHHCAQPAMHCMNVPATARASFAFYNTMEEVDALAVGIQKVIEVFS